MSNVKVGIIIFPGSNCDRDCHHVVSEVLGHEAQYIWHKETRLPDLDCLILPGGFSYGDYLRAGAIARFSPIMSEVVAFAKKGGRVLGICNGFQVLVEAGLLPGTLQRNAGLKFVCQDVRLEVDNAETAFTRTYQSGQQVTMPVAHMEGRYYASEETLKLLEGEGRVAFRYVGTNPNGSLQNIAGITNEMGTVLGMMPHPERCAEALLGNTDGKGIFESLYVT